MSLLELLIGAGLGAMLLTLIISFLVPTLRASSRGTTRVQLQQTTMVALEKMVTDIKTTAVGGLSITTEAPVTIAINPLLTVTDDGYQVWDARLIVYTWRAHADPLQSRLVRKTFPPRSPAAPFTLPFNASRPYRCADAAELHKVANVADAYETVLAADVKSFAISHAGDGAAGLIGDPITIQLGLERKESSKADPETFSMTRTVSTKQQL